VCRFLGLTGSVPYPKGWGGFLATQGNRGVESGYARQEFARDLSFDSLRGDPEFQALIEIPALQ
jgi:hypothetical protein